MQIPRWVTSESHSHHHPHFPAFPLTDYSSFLHSPFRPARGNHINLQVDSITKLWFPALLSPWYHHRSFQPLQGPFLEASLILPVPITLKDKPIYFIMNGGAFGFGLLQLLPFPPPNLPTYLPIPASPPSSSPLEPCCVIHIPPLASVSPSLTPSLSLQMSSHPQHPHSLFHLRLSATLSPSLTASVFILPDVFSVHCHLTLNPTTLQHLFSKRSPAPVNY